MKVTFSVGTVTLCDDTAAPRIAGIIEQFGGKSAVQEVDLYLSADAYLAALGNVKGRFVFTADCSYATDTAAAAAWKAAYGLLNNQGTCVLTYGGTTTTMANAVIDGVERTYWQGVQLIVRYSINIRTMT